MPGVPLFVLPHQVPDAVPAGDPPYTFVTEASNAPSSRSGPPPRAETWPHGGVDRPAGLQAGLLDELVISLGPVVLGRGARPLDGLEPGSAQLDLVRVVDAPGVTHLSYRVLK